MSDEGHLSMSPGTNFYVDDIVSSVPVMIWVVSPGGGAKFFNSGWLAFTGRALADEMDSGWLSGVHPDDRDAVVAAFAGDEHETVEMEFRLRRQDGAYRAVLARGALRLAAGGMGSYVGAALDVTERRQLEMERTHLLQEAQEANARLAGLQELTARLASLTRPEEVAEVVLGQGVAELGGTSGSLCLLSADGQEMVVAAQVGYPTEVTTSWGRFPVEASTPAGDAVRQGEAIYLTTLQDLHTRYPIFRNRPIVGDEAVAVLPLTTADRGMLGAMVIGFQEARPFSPSDRRWLSALSAQAATALARTESRAALEAAQAQLAYLADASDRLASSLDLDETMATVASLAVPRLADRCSLYLLANGRVETSLLEPGDPSVDIQTFLQRYPVDLNEPHGVGAVLRTGRSEFLPKVDEAILAEGVGDSDRHELLRRIGFGAVHILPLRVGGTTLGALALTNSTGRTMASHEKHLAEELAARASVAIANAVMYSKQTDVARRLQTSLLPSALPTVSGLDLAARFASAGEGIEVGGDFYDCIECGPDTWLVVVGDVKGKGVDAAALTGLARHTIRAAAVAQPDPAAVLATLNQVLVRHEAERKSTHGDDDWEASEPRFCTVAAIALTREGTSFEATIVSAGHPLPMVRHPDGQVTPVGQAGDLLGIDPTVHLPKVVVTLDRGAVLACFTDGVSECHDGTHFFDETGIADVLAGAVGSAEQIAAKVEAAARGFISGLIIRDDMAIVIAQVVPAIAG